MNIGKLDRLISIRKATYTNDAYGQPIPEYQVVAEVWARFEFEKGRAGFEADTFVGENPVKAIIRYRSDLDSSSSTVPTISSDFQVLYNSKVWFIRSTEEIGRKEGLILRLETKTSPTAS